MDHYLPQFFAAEATIHLKDGTVYTSFVKHTKGDPENPMTWEEIEEKFVTLAKLTISSEERIRKIVECVNKLDKMNVADLCQLL